jgi:ATP/maltotriose-dependent transcriptional regulator MalT
MAEFAETVGDARLRDRLEVALDGHGAFRRFKNVLLDFLAERERWFAFRDARLRAAAREWLAEQGIDPTTVPRERQT